MHSRQRSGETADAVFDYADAECRVSIAIPVGIDQDFADVRGQPLQYPTYERSAAKQLQPLVDIAHAAGETTGENDSRDWRHGGVRGVHGIPVFDHKGRGDKADS
jgi:hypothetical protein